MDSAQDYWTAKALLEWQVEMGADEAILDAPVDRYALAEAKKAETPVPKKQSGPPQIPVVAEIDVVAKAKQMASGASSVEELAERLAGFEHCEIKQGARNFVFSSGLFGAHVMVIAESPRREDDRDGAYFAGQIGTLADRMFGAIGLSRNATDAAKGVYFAPVIPWRTPSDRTLTATETAMMLPFLQAHVALARPKVLVLMGSSACQAFLGRGGLTRQRGQWAEVNSIAAMPMYHPEMLLRDPLAKRDAWADLLAIKSKLDGAQ